MNETEKLKKQLPKIKWISVGECSKCGKEFVRDCEVDAAACTCSSAVVVDLSLAAILPAKLERYFAVLARRDGCSNSEDIFNLCLQVGFGKLPKLLAKRSVLLGQLRKRLLEVK